MEGVVRLYATPFSQPCRAVLLMLQHNSIPHEFVFTDLASGYHHTAAFAKLNPQRKVPVIEVLSQAEPSPFVLSESHAILRFLANAFPVDALAASGGRQGIGAGATPKERAVVDLVLDWKANVLRPKLGGLLVRFMLDSQIVPTANIRLSTPPASRSECERLADEGLVALGALLERHGALPSAPATTAAAPVRFIAGTTQPTIADLAVVCELTQLRLVFSLDAGFWEQRGLQGVGWWMDVVAARVHGFERAHSFLARMQRRLVDKAQSAKL